MLMLRKYRFMKILIARKALKIQGLGSESSENIAVTTINAKAANVVRIIKILTEIGCCVIFLPRVGYFSNHFRVISSILIESPLD